MNGGLDPACHEDAPDFIGQVLEKKGSGCLKDLVVFLLVEEKLAEEADIGGVLLSVDNPVEHQAGGEVRAPSGVHPGQGQAAFNVVRSAGDPFAEEGIGAPVVLPFEGRHSLVDLIIPLLQADIGTVGRKKDHIHEADVVKTPDLLEKMKEGKGFSEPEKEPEGDEEDADPTPAKADADGTTGRWLPYGESEPS